MATASRFAGYFDLDTELARLWETGNAEAALALVAAERPNFPRQVALLHLWRMSLAVAVGRIDHAIQALEEALTAGCRYPAPLLREWPAIAPLHDFVEFERLVHIAAMRYDAELMASRPTLLVERPDLVAPPAGLPLLVALHGTDWSVQETVPFWRAALACGYVLAVPGSAQIALAPGRFVWNDGHRAELEVTAQIERLVGEQRVDPDRIVLAGFSAGALRALQLAYGPAVHARAAIALAPWLPLRHTRQSPAAPPARVIISGTKEIDELMSARPVRTFIAVGENDTGAHEGALTLAERLRQRGVPVATEVIAGEGHRYPPEWDAILGRALEFALA
jgi:predicted esterase